MVPMFVPHGERSHAPIDNNASLAITSAMGELTVMMVATKILPTVMTAIGQALPCARTPAGVSNRKMYATDT